MCDGSHAQNEGIQMAFIIYNNYYFIYQDVFTSLAFGEMNISNCVLFM